jgi:hypothetical protein
MVQSGAGDNRKGHRGRSGVIKRNSYTTAHPTAERIARVGLAPTGKRRLVTARAESGHQGVLVFRAKRPNGCCVLIGAELRSTRIKRLV